MASLFGKTVYPTLAFDTHDELPSNFAFDFKLRHYKEGKQCAGRVRGLRPGLGRAVQVASINSTVKAPETKLLKLKHDSLPSSFAFNFKLRRYISGKQKWTASSVDLLFGRAAQLNHCFALLNLRLLSALETSI